MKVVIGSIIVLIVLFASVLWPAYTERLDVAQQYQQFAQEAESQSLIDLLSTGYSGPIISSIEVEVPTRPDNTSIFGLDKYAFVSVSHSVLKSSGAESTDFYWSPSDEEIRFNSELNQELSEEVHNILKHSQQAVKFGSEFDEYPDIMNILRSLKLSNSTFNRPINIVSENIRTNSLSRFLTLDVRGCLYYSATNGSLNNPNIGDQQLCFFGVPNAKSIKIWLVGVLRDKKLHGYTINSEYRIKLGIALEKADAVNLLSKVIEHDSFASIPLIGLPMVLLHALDENYVRSLVVNGQE